MCFVFFRGQKFRWRTSNVRTLCSWMRPGPLSTWRSIRILSSLMKQVSLTALLSLLKRHCPQAQVMSGPWPPDWYDCYIWLIGPAPQEHLNITSFTEKNTYLVQKFTEKKTHPADFICSQSMVQTWALYFYWINTMSLLFHFRIGPDGHLVMKTSSSLSFMTPPHDF